MNDRGWFTCVGLHIEGANHGFKLCFSSTNCFTDVDSRILDSQNRDRNLLSPRQRGQRCDGEIGMW